MKKFSIKTHRIPITRKGKEIILDQVERNNDNLEGEQTINIEERDDLPVEATKIGKFNQNQISLACMDVTIDSVLNKTLCEV